MRKKGREQREEVEEMRTGCGGREEGNRNANHLIGNKDSWFWSQSLFSQKWKNYIKEDASLDGRIWFPHTFGWFVLEVHCFSVPDFFVNANVICGKRGVNEQCSSGETVMIMWYKLRSWKACVMNLGHLLDTENLTLDTIVSVTFARRRSSRNTGMTCWNKCREQSWALI